LEEADSVFAGATVFSCLGVSLLPLGAGAVISCFTWMEEPPIVGLMTTGGGFSATLGTSVLAGGAGGGGFRGAIGDAWSSFLLSIFIWVSKSSFSSVEGLSFMRTVIKAINRAITTANKRMLVVDKSKNMICHTSERLKHAAI